MSNPAATFVFADIAGFTALTEAHGDEAAFALVSDFTSAVRAELTLFEESTSRRSGTR